MRYATCCVLGALVALPLAAESLAPAPPALTVVLDFKQAKSGRAVVEEMKRQTEEILAGSGVHLDWKLRAEVGSESFSQLVLVTFKGDCSAGSHNDGNFIPGPLASTHISGDTVQPFADVFCDNVAALTHASITSRDSGRPDPIMGRALGKVLAHELMHMITRSVTHGSTGVAKPALTGRQLVDHETAMDSDDLDRIRDENVGGR